jgi:hypothetical protein
MFIIPVFTMGALAWQNAIRDPYLWEVRNELVRASEPAILMAFAAAVAFVARSNYRNADGGEWLVAVTSLTALFCLIIGIAEVTAIEVGQNGYRSPSPYWIHPDCKKTFPDMRYFCFSLRRSPSHLVSLHSVASC